MINQIDILPNGLKVAVKEISGRNSVSVGIWVKVGSRYEPAPIAGISHFAEHLLFKGTKKRSTRQIKEAIEGLGGVFNAFTGEESTCYFVKILKNHFPLALDVLADMVKNSVFKPGDIARERTVILEEIKMYQDQPAQLAQEHIHELLWPAQALGRNIAGLPKTVAAIKRGDIVNFQKRFYQPANLLITVCGAVTRREALARIKKYFARDKGGKVSDFQPALSRQDGPRFHFQSKDTEQVHLAMAFHGPSRESEDRYSATLLNVILGGNMSSRLFEAVREKRGLVYEIRSSLMLLQDAGAVGIFAGMEKHNLEICVRLIMQELKKLRARPVTAMELKQAKEYVLGQLDLALEDTLEYMLWMGERVLYSGKPVDIEKLRRNIRRVSAAEIQRVAGKYLAAKQLNIAVVGPVDKKTQAKIKKEIIQK